MTIKRVAPCQCLDRHVQEPYEMSMSWEPNRRSNFFSPTAHLCAITYMTEILLSVTFSNQSLTHYLALKPFETKLLFASSRYLADLMRELTLLLLRSKFKVTTDKLPGEQDRDRTTECIIVKLGAGVVHDWRMHPINFSGSKVEVQVHNG